MLGIIERNILQAEACHLQKASARNGPSGSGNASQGSPGLTRLLDVGEQFDEVHLPSRRQAAFRLVHQVKASGAAPLTEYP